MYHSNKLLLVKTNMSGLYVSSLFVLHSVTLSLGMSHWNIFLIQWGLFYFFYDLQISREVFASSRYSHGWIRGTYLLVGESRCCIFTILSVTVKFLRGWQVQLNNAVLCSSCHSTRSITSQLSTTLSKWIPILSALLFRIVSVCRTCMWRA